MAKLIRYNSFETLKLDIKPSKTNSPQSIERHVAMESFVNLLRRRLVEKKELQKKNLKIS